MKGRPAHWVCSESKSKSEDITSTQGENVLSHLLALLKDCVRSCSVVLQLSVSALDLIIVLLSKLKCQNILWVKLEHIMYDNKLLQINWAKLEKYWDRKVFWIDFQDGQIYLDLVYTEVIIYCTWSLIHILQLKSISCCSYKNY